jgi:hypothetical protein
MGRAARRRVAGKEGQSYGRVRVIKEVAGAGPVQFKERAQLIARRHPGFLMDVSQATKSPELDEVRVDGTQRTQAMPIGAEIVSQAIGISRIRLGP